MNLMNDPRESVVNDNHQKPDVLLPGYELIEKIGAGGYGEVWSAMAPGGLHKAVKYVFGNEFDKRAISEMNALQKVKSVRHPFLLSLERIEVVDGRLIVVSELADGSLRDRFRECFAEGLPGIPRDELLGYLADAADALDYLADRHELAHLDIKPENLLLVAGHVKVADFGLVKSLSLQTQASLVGGMTPAYAAPEVFRGVPTRHSDQYSLAILYQEMLTGAPTFAGANAAELTLQHMKDDPDLHSLGGADRFAVARALSKDPANRFDSARAFVAALRSQPTSSAFDGAACNVASPPESREAFTAPAANRFSVTEVFEDNPAETGPGGSELATVRPAPLVTPKPSEVSAPDADASPFAAAPAVFIGVGGTGARVLRALRAQMRERLGATAPLPAAPMLLFDTDSRTLAAASIGGDRGIGLDAGETVSLPLRRPQAYRDKSELLLRWLGRRWLYNVPRSLQTEGIRPLGRLALVDHARQAFQRLRSVVSGAIEPDSRDASTEAIGLSFDQPGLRVYVVGSTAGGTGSGMSIDIAYAVRSIVKRLGVEDATVIGVMTHSTFRENSRSELARVNSYAWLSEFEQFRQSDQGYPGDSSVGLPEHERGVEAFDHTYFVPLGEQIDTPALESAAEAVAEYLFADAFTTGQRLLDAFRAQRADAKGSTLRSFAVRHRDSQGDTTLSPLESAAVSRMLDRWVGVTTDEPPATDLNSTDQVVHGAVAFLGRTQLDASTLASNCRSILEASLGGDASAYFEARFGADRSRNLAALGGKIDEGFGIVSADDEPTKLEQKVIDTIIEPMVNKLAEESIAWTIGRVNDTQERLEGADRAIRWLEDHLNAVEADLQKVMANVVADRARVVKNNAKGDKFKLFRLRLDHAALVAARRISQRLREQLRELPAELTTLRDVIESLRPAVNLEALDAPPSEIERFSIALEQRLQADYLTSHGGLLGALAEETRSPSLAGTIAHGAKRVARDGANASRAAADAALTAGFAEPPLQDCGGDYCHLTIQQTSPTDTTEESELLLVTEMAGVSLPHLAASLIGGRRDYAAYAERVRTRRDIEWRDPVLSADKTPSPLVSTVGVCAGPMVTAVL
ncbi:Tubulin-like protein [Planctomycetes bacterium K2D]|uniref:Tubulin-like protein n=2 Tax=Botrimarina mediterranea TaxID=2528022 RepID=A0A518KAR6_9BACT|nr:Tubulin-like protein [Botrimarina mediterranea]QDV79524.1 Tubulin-like protein [Planctomycetes bacterium K2D]